MAFSLFRRSAPTTGDPMSWPEFKERAFPVFDDAFGKLGFERFDKMEWVEPNASDDGVRRIFFLEAFKGGGVTPAWGYSFDFVPHISGDTVHWHRTPKSAQPDVWIGAPKGEMDMKLLDPVERLESHLPRIAKRAAASATKFWKPVPRLADLPGLFRSIEEIRRKRKLHGFDLLTQGHLSWAFTLARLGEMSEAQERFNHWAGQRKPPDMARQRMQDLLRASRLPRA